MDRDGAPLLSLNDGERIPYAVRSKGSVSHVRRFVWLWLVLLVSLPSCGPGRDRDRPKAPGTGKPRVALVMKSLANEFFSTMADGARAHQKAHDDEYELVVNGIKDERDLARQVSLVEEMVAQDVDALVIAPADSKALVTACKRAQEAGVTVVNIDNRLDESVLASAGIKIPFVGPDNRKGARAVGEILANKLVPGDEVAILEGVRTADNAVKRRLGFEDAMTAAGMKIVDSQSGEWEMDVANRVTSAMIGEHPRLKALLCSNDSMALGALAAVKAAGREGEIRVVGFDDISAIREAVRKGEVLATADQHADQLAVYGIEYALRILRGGVEPEDRETPVDVVTAESLR
jgi:ribose transport system substrate-binding protein